MKAGTKELIRNELKALIKNSSQGRVARKAGVNSATISRIINGNFKLISDEMWRKIQVALKLDFDWKTAPIENFKKLEFLLKEAKTNAESICVSWNAGAGKTHTYRLFEKTNKNVIYVECSEWTQIEFLEKMLISLGGKSKRKTKKILFEKVVESLMILDEPLVIIDQMDKLTTGSFRLYMDLYNRLEGFCGFVLSGVNAFEKRHRKRL